MLNRISLVIPVYRGADSLPPLILEVARLTTQQRSPAGHTFIVNEVLLVHDCGPDKSGEVIEQLALDYAFIRPVWLSRNFGQHAATMAGMAATTGDWIVTLDEDGQHDPAYIPNLLDSAIVNSLQIVYAKPDNDAPHGWLRNLASRVSKIIASWVMSDKRLTWFNSFRLIDGEIGRTLAAYCGSGVYLDVALRWVANSVGQTTITLRQEHRRASGYSYSKLIGHFWNLILTTGTRPLRLITIMGFVSVAVSFALFAYVLYLKIFRDIPTQGWASLIVAVAFFSGAILTALGVISEYLAATMSISMGKPLYVVATKPTRTTDII